MGRSFRLRLKQVEKDFTLHGRAPVAISGVVRHEMKESLVPLSEVEDGSYYGINKTTAAS